MLSTFLFLWMVAPSIQAARPPRPVWTVDEAAHFAARRDYELLQLLGRDRKAFFAAKHLNVFGAKLPTQTISNQQQDPGPADSCTAGTSAGAKNSRQRRSAARAAAHRAAKAGAAAPAKAAPASAAATFSSDASRAAREAHDRTWRAIDRAWGADCSSDSEDSVKRAMDPDG